MGLEKTEFLWNADDNERPRSFLGLLKLYSDKKATSLKQIALFACPVHVVLLNLNAKQRRYLVDHGHTLFGFFPIQSEEMEIRGEKAGPRKAVPRYGFTSLEAVPPETAKLHIFSSSS